MVCDHAENMGIPCLGAKQPADLYYLSQFTGNIFSITDVTSALTTMCAFTYKYDKGKWDIYDVSPVVTGLVDLGLIRDSKVDKPLIIIMDNCGVGKIKIVFFSLHQEFSW
jgi:hypothetical protein